MQGVILGAIGGVILPNDDADATSFLLWTIAGTTQITEEAASAIYTVSYTGDMLAPDETVTIDVDTADGTASSGVDYTGVATTLTFTEGGATQKTLAVTIVEDTIVEGTEDYTIALSAPSRGSLAVSQVNTLIVDEDATSLVWSIAGSTEIDEGDPGAYTVSYTGVTLAPGQVATITVASAALAGGDADATAGVDYTAASTVLTFTGGGVTSKTVAVSTIEDTAIEGTEDFRVTIAGQSIGTLNTSQVDTDIVDDDAASAADAVTFDGTNDVLLRGADLSGNADGKEGTVSFGIKFNGGDGVEQRIYSAFGGSFLIRKLSDNKIEITGQNVSGPSNILTLVSTGTYTVASGWILVQASWNLATGAAHLYVADANVLAGSPVVTNDTLDYTRTNHAIGGTTAGTSKINADLFDFWFSHTYIDLSVTADRRKFISATGKPVDLGATGEIPTGSAPIIFLHLDDGETPADNFAANAGPGGGFTVNGALVVAATSPTD